MKDYSFDEYLEMSRSLPMEVFHSVHQMMLDEIECDTEDIAQELYEDLVDAAIKYANIRARWTRMTYEEKSAEDAGRTILHNRCIDCVNIMERYLKKIGQDASWRDKLGRTEEDPGNRRPIGDFACYLAFVHGLHGR